MIEIQSKLQRTMNQVITGIADHGFAVIENALPDNFCLQLLQVMQSYQEDEFKQAGVGRNDDFQTNLNIRNDFIKWLPENESGAADYFELMEQLRLQLNRHFYLGLFEYECMFAHYPENAFYQKHVDAFKGGHQPGNNRKITTILYLNPTWESEDGGELLLYQHKTKEPFKTVLPTMGTMVVFLSEDFPHEVLPAKKSRFSITGWFRVK